MRSSYLRATRSEIAASGAPIFDRHAYAEGGALINPRVYHSANSK
jgi:hypothetical protein